MTSIPPGESNEQQGPLPEQRRGWRFAITSRRCIIASIVLAPVVCVFVVWQLLGPHRISSVNVATMRGEGTVDGFIIMVDGKGAPPTDARATINSVVLVDSESDPHFRIKLTLWDGQERELKVGYVAYPIDSDKTHFPDRKTQIQAQLARTRRDGVVTCQIEYSDTTWRGGSHQIAIADGVPGQSRSVPVSIIKE